MLYGEQQFKIAADNVRDLAERRLSGEMDLRGLDRAIKSLSTVELGRLTALLLKSPLDARCEDAQDSDGPPFVTAWFRFGLFSSGRYYAIGVTGALKELSAEWKQLRVA